MRPRWNSPQVARILRLPHLRPSYRRTESNSCLDDSHDGAFTCSTCTPTSPSRSSLFRSAEIRRRRHNRCLTCLEDTSDKENTASGYRPLASRSTMSTWTKSCSATPMPASSTAAVPVLDLREQCVDGAGRSFKIIDARVGAISEAPVTR